MRRTFFPYLLSVLLMLAAAFAAQFLVRSEKVAAFILPPPSLVLRALWSDFGLILPHLWSTLQITLLGIVLALLLALLFALLMDLFRSIEAMFYPVIVIFQIVPFILFAPLLVVWFGYGRQTQLIAVVMMVVFPLLVTLKSGFRSISREQLQLLRSMGASSWQLYRWLKLPTALSSLFSGLRLSVTYGMGGAVISEWVGALQGLGVLMLRSQKSFLLPRVFAINLLIIVVSLLLYALVLGCEKVILPWKKYL